MSSAAHEHRRYSAVCGEYCLSCSPGTDTHCRGCAYQLGRSAHGECPIFQCAMTSRGLEHCGLCPDFPCQTFLQSGDGETVRERIASLRRRAEIGTDRWLDEHVAKSTPHEDSS